MKKLSILLSIFLIPLALGSFVFANELSGRVTDKTTGSTVANARIHLWKDGKTPYYPTVTDSHGGFTIKNIAEGNYGITVFHPSYVKKIIKGVKIRPNRSISLPLAQLALETFQYELTPIEKQSFGNSKIMGRVLDKKTKEPLVSTRIRLFSPEGKSAKIGTLTDDKGNFLLLNIPPAVYQIDISGGPNYDNQRIKKVNVEAGCTYSLGTILLNKTFFEGDTLIVYGPHR